MSNPSMFDVYMGILSIVQAVDPTLPIIIKGVDMPALDKVDEFLQFDYLGDMSLPSRVTQINDFHPFQVTCFSRSAFMKQEGGATKFAAHVEMADRYKNILHQRNYPIKNSCIRLGECRISFLDLRTSTFTAKNISTGTTPLLNCQSAVLLVDGRIITNKE